MVLILRDARPELGDIDFGSWAVGSLFNLIGILLVCLPAARPIGASSISLPLKLAIFVAIGAAGGGGILAILGLSASVLNHYDPFDLRAGLLGVFGLLPGAITAAVWFAINRDIFHSTKDASFA